MNILLQEPCIHSTQRDVYHLSFELKTNNKGDNIPHTGPAINQGVTQVLRGVSGLINYLFEAERRSYQEERIVRFVPVIFTTAQLWVTEVDVGAANLSDGNLSIEAVQAKKIDWIWFNHNRSPHLRHSLEWNKLGSDLSRELKYEFTRSVAVVGPDGIDNFLAMDLEAWLE